MKLYVIRMSCLLLLALFAAYAVTVQAGTLTGKVTGKADPLSWRKGKTTLGWVSVRVWQDGKLLQIGRTDLSGAFALELPAGDYEVELIRPAFLPQRRPVAVPATGEVRCDAELAPDPDFRLIVTPRAGMAEFCLPGETVPVEAAATRDARQWAAWLFTDYQTLPLEMDEVTFGEQAVWNDTRPGWRLSLRVPEDTPPGTYHLRLFCTDASGARHICEQPVAVRVLAAYPNRFRLLLHADWHFDFYVGLPGVDGERQADYFRAASLLDALWVSLGDDIGFEGDDHVAMFWHMLRHYSQVPVFLAFGNHDAAITQEGHEYYFGPPVQTRAVGPAIGLVRSFDLYQADWYMPEAQGQMVRAALERFAAQPNRRLLCLAGHQERWQPPGRHFEFPEARAGFLRPRHVRGAYSHEFERLFLDSMAVMTMHGWGGLHYTARVADVDLEAGRLGISDEIILPSVSYAPANDGRSPRVTALVKSRGATKPAAKYEGVSEYFVQPPTEDKMVPYSDLSGLSVQFIMPRGRYQVDAGRIVQHLDAGNVTIVRVLVDAAGEETIVTVSPAQ